MYFFCIPSGRYLVQGSPEQVNRPSDKAKRTLQAPQPIAGAGNWELHIADNRLVWSDEIYKIFGIAHDSFPSTAKGFYSFIHPEDRQRLYVDTQRALRGEEPMDAEHRIVLPDGSLRHVHTRAVLIVDEGGKPSLLSGTVHDITALKQANEALHRSLQELSDMKLAVDQHAIMAVTDQRGIITYVNEKFCRISHYSREELIGRSHNIVNSGYHSKAFMLELWRTISGGKVWRGEIKNRTKSGATYWVDTTIVPFCRGDQRPHQYVAIRTDITARKKSEREVQRLASHLRITLESITDAFLTLDRQWRFTYMNSESERLLRRRRGEMLGKVIWEELPDLLGSVFEAEARAAVNDNRSVEFEALSESVGRWYSMRGYPSEDGLTVYFHDITERKKIESEVAASAERFRAVARVTADAIWDWNLARDHIWWSDGIKKLFDLDWYEGDGTVDGSLWVEHIHPDDRAAIVDSIQRAIQGDAVEWRAEYRFLRRDGSFADVVDHAVLIRDAEGHATRMVGGMNDITERKRTLVAMMSVAASGAASNTVEFFRQLALTMADALGAQAAFVGRVLPDQPFTMRAVAATLNGALLENFDYSIEGPCCETLLRDHELEIHDDFELVHPKSALLALLDVKAFAGRLLLNSAGDMIGILFVAFTKPIRQSDFMLSTMRIFAARAAAELERRDADARIREQASLLDKAQDAIIVRGIDHRIQFWNKSAERLYGWRAEEVVGHSMEKMLFPQNAAFVEATRQVMEFGEWSGEIAQQRKHGSTLMVEGRWTLVRDEQGAATSILCINTDITQRKAAEQKIQRLAFYDSLTQLPNRLLLLERLQQAISVKDPQRRVGALLFIDLDNFKNLNDTLGHDKGDLLLKQVAQRLTACLRENDTVARLGGDEFVLLLEDISENPAQAAAQAESIGHKIIGSFNLPFYLDSYEYFSTPSIGVTLFNDAACSVDELLKRADIAMYQAKACGRNAMRFFDPGMQAVVSARAELEADMRHGLLENEFILHYQPQVLSDGTITGAEVLLRWEHPRRGLVSPMEFIPLAEDTGLITALGEYVLEAACRQLALWGAQSNLEPGLRRLGLSVNVSAYQFRHPDFVEAALEIIDRSGADPHKLKLELTESLLVADVEEIICEMSVLKARGVGFSLDDFGTGYSSLSYLKRLPLDELKIDQSFIRDVLTDPNDAVIARTIVALAQSLGLAVIAEGVETEAQREFLANNNCHAYQGYLFSKPLPLAQFEAFIREATARE
ncbi:EAL domain-containing protein [Oxalobacteraceae bacterium CAVE-383]|nr:EAL domain-containing protein [Oxalobacteraceae bacterium CAVE-383]